MGYVAIKGGEDAIDQALRLVEFYRIKDRTRPAEIAQIRDQLRALVDKIMAEGSLYAPDHAALALKQVEGDPFEGGFILRAFRATLDRRHTSESLDTRAMRLVRRVSALHRQLPGGQLLGATRDFAHKFVSPGLDAETADASALATELARHAAPESAVASRFPSASVRVIDRLREAGLFGRTPGLPGRVVDITREAVKHPAPRSAALQMLARGETGGMNCLAYASLRGHGDIRPLLAELRVGDVPVRVRDTSGRIRVIGALRVTEADVVARLQKPSREGVPYLSHGYGLVFGRNENKAVSMAVLDRSTRENQPEFAPQNAEFVLYHTDGVESYGFTNHLKLPHYVTFQSGLNNLRQAVERKEKTRGNLGFGGAPVNTAKPAATAGSTAQPAPVSTQ